MKKLLSLPPNLVDCFHDVTGLSHDEYFCSCDPIGHRLGSGGGTTWLLQEAWRAEKCDQSFSDWVKKGTPHHSTCWWPEQTPAVLCRQW
jgi:hypothetical protein